MPLSWTQQRLWFLAQLDPAAQAAYHMSVGLNLQGRLDLDALQAALDRIVARHEILRTIIVTVEDEAQQRIRDADSGFSLIQQDFSLLFSEQQAEQQAAIEKVADLEANHPFDLVNGPLARGRLLKLAEDRHILLLTQHHIISDGWSVGIFMQELSTLYRAFSQGQPDPLPALTIQYADYVLWQKNALQGEVRETVPEKAQGKEPEKTQEKQIAFWRNTLQGAPALLELPTDRPRPAKQSYLGGRVNIALPPALQAGLKALGQRHGTTLFMTLLAGWAVLLSRLSGQDDLVIGTPVANRQQPELAPLIGFFANTLALRVQLHEAPRVSDLLAQVKEQAINAFAHQDLPFEQLVEILQPPRSLSHSPIFQVMLATNNTPGSRHFDLPGLVLDERPLIRNSAYFDLTLTLDEAENGLVGDLEYARDLFDHATVERLVSQLNRVLTAMVADDSQRVTELPLLTPEQRKQVVVDFNNTTLRYPPDTLIHQLFEQQAALMPDAIALVYQDTQLRYAELNQRANQLAHRLIAFGIRPDVRVALCVERSPEMIIGMLAILKAGAGYVPFDPEYPAERLAYQLSDSTPVLLLTQQHLQASLPQTGVPVWWLDGETHRKTVAQQPTHNPDASQSGLLPHHLAYIIYTSGSTGLPKGVMLEHRNVVNFIHAQHQISQPRPGDRILQFATMAFDTSVSDIFPTLAAGATLVLRPAHIRVPDSEFIDFLQQQKITIMDVPTAFWHQWVQEMKAGRTGFSPDLHTVIVGGEKAEYRYLADWQSFPETHTCRWINTYGPTETTVIVTSLILNGGASDEQVNSIPIGRPNANTRIYILDPLGQPVPVGVNGEICIGGAGVARGYLNRPELTAERFVPDPFSTDPDARLYKSGDLGRWLPDGKIEYSGRNDFQVKIRGFRIELGEIEAQLAACDGVKDVVVIAREDTARENTARENTARENTVGDKRLVAYLLPQPDVTLTPSDLREQLSIHLMEHMIPSAFVILEAFPLTGSGKLDRKALPAPDRSAIASREYEAPQGEIEQKLAAVWQSLLGLEHVGRHDNFFELGGHSLLTVQMAARLRQVFNTEVNNTEVSNTEVSNINIDLQDLFTHPILSDLAQLLSTARQPAQHCSSPPAQPVILPADRQQVLPLSWAQQRLWFLAQLDSAAQTAYHLSGGLRLQGQLNRNALHATLDRIVARHEILRTTIKMADGIAQQVIAGADWGFNLTFNDLSPLTEAAKQAAIDEAARFETHHPFDFALEPLIRGQLLKLTDNEHVLLFTQHHMVSDGWSLNILIHELTTLYRAFTQGQDDPLPALPVQYADYALWQRQWLQGDVLEKQVSFWRETLQGAPALLELPTDRARPAVQRYHGDQVALVLSPELSDGIKALSQRHGVTLFMTLLAAWSILLARTSGQHDIVIGTPVANRQHSELEPLIGFFANTLALRVKLEDNPTVSSLLAHVKAHALAAYVHQDLPFEQLVEALQPPRSLSHSPIFQVMLALDNTPIQQSLELSGLVLDELPLARQSTHFDLSLSINETETGLVGELEYASDLFDRTSIERLAGYLQTLLAAMVADDSRRVQALPLLQPQQRNQLLVAFNDTALAYPQDRLIHQLFEQQVEQTPDATALVSGDSQLSYAELNRHANQLAHYLMAAGVRPDDRIALCADRSLEMIIGMYAILKAGAGYIPLDPEYPAERLAYQLSDSQPAGLLTQRHLQSRLAKQDVPVWLLDDEAQRSLVAKQPSHNPDARQMGLKPHHLAYIIYTSGSTGQPKGVMLEHRNVVNFIHAQRQTSEPQSGDRILQFATVAFDTSVSDIFPTLASGATLVLRPPHIRIPDMTFVTFLREQKITIMDMPTAFWHHWVQEMMAGRSGFSPYLHTLIVGGDKAEYRHLISWLSSPETQSCRWINSYGPTETTVIATTLTVDNKNPLPRENVIPIGYPLPNTRIYILDTLGQPVPIGVSGEIHIGGAGVARGYLHRADLTAEKFVADPFSPQPDARMYKTGDLGRWLPDGTIEYLGRNDFQVKIRGFRVELGEIESQLAACEGVSDAVVIAREETREDSLGDKRLVAYLIPQSGVTLNPAHLREQLSATLMEHMLPSAFVMLAAFPLSANGKLDRNALPPPDQSAMVSREYAAPQGETEQKMATIWQSLLGLEHVGRHDNFFELGGHSLLVVNLIEALRRHDLFLDVSTVFSAPTLAAMSARLNQDTAQGAGKLAVPPNLIRQDSRAITPDMLPLVALTQNQIDQMVSLVPDGVTNIQDIYPLGPLQAGILFHHLLDTEGDLYLDNQLMAFDSRTRLDTFLQVLQRVIDRHDILRSAVHWQELPEPVQVVYRRALLPVVEITLPEITWSGEEHAEAQLRRLTDPRTVRMDISKAPLLAAHIARDPDSGQWLLSLLHHHLVCDHISLGMIFNEIKALVLGENDTLPVPLPYRNFIAQTRSVPPEVHQAYFREQLGDVEEPTLPFGLLEVQGGDLNKNGLNKIAGDTLTLDSELAYHLRDCARQSGISAAVLFHVAWAQVLARCSGRDDVVFGTVLSGRLQGGVGASEVLGMFINTLPVRIQLQARTVKESVQETHQRLSELLDHEQASLAVAQRCSGIQAPLPLFNSLLNFRHSPRYASPSASLAWEGVQVLSGEERSNYPLSLDVDDFDDGFALTAQCHQQINPARINAYMNTALEGIIAALQHAPEQQIASLDILSPVERTQLLATFNDTAAGYPQQGLIHQLFEQQAAQAPAATALVCGDRQLSYAELNRHANQLAHQLIAAGVRPDDRVAICVERSPEMIIGLYGILKAGAGYVPLDPEYPAERLAYQLSDSKPVLLLTQQHLQERLPIQDSPVWCLDADSHRNQVAKQPTDNPDAHQMGLKPHHLAYIIYTSGSTGQPKGVMLEHRNVVNFIHAQRQTSEPQSGDRILQFATIAFDTSVSDIFPTLAAGATLVLRPPHIRVPDATFVDFLREQKITIMDMPTAFWHHWVQEMTAGRSGFSPYLHTIIVGGEKAEYRHLISWLSSQETQSCRWINSYGPTETTVIATTLTVDVDNRQVTYPHDHIPIGRPLPNTRIYILDTLGQPVPLGVSGEIHIAGAGVARGYLNRPDLTAEKFGADPFSEHADARMYKTGDLGRWLPGGMIEYLGRNDFQVKIRGFRIEMGEIEAQLVACEGVSDAVVIAREAESGDKRLVAYVIPQSGFTPDANRLREQLSTRLAGYMVPNAFVMLEAFPLSGSGKLDRKALPAPDRTAIAGREYAAPQGEIEQQIAAILQNLLGLAQIGRHDSFFDLGGNSLSIIQLMARLRDEFQLEVSIQDIFAHPALSELAELIASRQIETFFAQDDLESLQKELENLSEDELRALLHGDSELNE
ncbi:amino acid adenylation domain-containing protein [Xenorhabdus sp. IM139775]|uniref:amino acid adenylation domain-containing protein n=1 Tax=Xenorhabdus sp. IM139775 TaxID=3025876 RepID=UPI003FD2E6EE